MHTLLPIPAFSDNYIWAVADQARRVLLVDPGDGEAAFTAIQQQQWQPQAVLITHHHADHTGALPQLKQRWPALPIIGPQDSRIHGLDQRVGDGDRIEIASMGLQFQVIAVPGHTLSHIAFVGDPWLFCGDTLFSLGCGRLFEGSPAQMLDSLDRLAALPEHLLVCCAHEYTAANGRFALQVDPGNSALSERVSAVAACRAMNQASLPVTLSQERVCNPFLRCDDPAVLRGIARLGGGIASGRIDAFARLRRLKDEFQG